MRFRPSSLAIAPGFLGAFFLALVCSSCKEEDRDPGGIGQPPASTAPAPTPAVSASAAAEPPRVRETKEDGRAIRFVAYNVENWLTMERFVNGKAIPGVAKPEKERRAVVEAILSSRPDILGISEIGNESDVEDLKKHLSDAGMPLPHSHLSRGGDPTRSLVILSRFPIGSTKMHENLGYRLGDRAYLMQRGILDASVNTPAGALRFLGVHLKSKREVEEGDQEEMRRSEGHLLRRELDRILQEDPQARLVVYGDFNDTRQSSTIKTVHGSGKGSRLKMVALKDSRGHYWTHHWSSEDVYSRIDYVFVSPALGRAVAWDQCKILDNGAVAVASDHRPLLVVLK